MVDSERPRLHFLGICGKAMGGIAASLAQDGWDVTGSDEKCYAPMEEHLRTSGVRFATPYRPENVPQDRELVVVGKRIAANNIELAHVLGSGLPHCSFPEFLKKRFLRRSRNAVVAGGLGKTTTTAMLAWIWEFNGWNPDYLIGGFARNFPEPARFRGSQYAVLEGDEYASCFDDPRPKFLHYHPEVAIITNVVEDHPDLYGSFGDLCEAFGSLIQLLPERGCLIVPDHDESAAQLAARAGCRVVSVGFGRKATACITHMQWGAERSVFRLQEVPFEIPTWGRMNVRNAAMAAMAARHFGLSLREAAQALGSFTGVRNRQEEKEFGSCTLVCDKATHPHALEELAGALRQRFQGRRLVSVIQPRATGGKEWIYQRNLPAALARFDKVVLTGSYEHAPHQPHRWTHNPFCLDLLAEEIAFRRVEIAVAPLLGELRETLAAHLRDGDVVVVTAMEQSETLRTTVEQSLREKAAVAESVQAGTPSLAGCLG